MVEESDNYGNIVPGEPQEVLNHTSCVALCEAPDC